MKSIPNILIIILLCLIHTNSIGQKTFPYRLSLQKEAVLLGSGFAMGGLGVQLGANNPAFTPAQIGQLRSADVLRIDRRATRQWNLTAGKWSDRLAYSALAMPVLVAISPKWQQTGTVAVMGFESLVIAGGLTQLVKNTARRPRPFVYNPEAPMSAKLERDAKRSFFSGHTSSAAAACFFSAQAFADIYPHSKWRPWVWGGAAALPLATGYLRYRAGKHFPTDIAVGYLVGMASGILVARWHRS